MYYHPGDMHLNRDKVLLREEDARIVAARTRRGATCGTRRPAMKIAWLLLTLMLLLPGGHAAVAAPWCPGKPIFSDDFAKLDAAWGKPSSSVNVKHGILFLTAPTGKLVGRFNREHRLHDFVICGMAAVAHAADGGDPLGVAFWITDTRNYYLFAITGVGSFAVLRIENGDVHPIVKWQRGTALKAGAGVWNALVVYARGDKVEFFVNNHQVGQITGSPPAAGTYMGLVVDANARGPAEWGFARLAVTDPDVPQRPKPTPSFSILQLQPPRKRTTTLIVPPGMGPFGQDVGGKPPSPHPPARRQPSSSPLPPVRVAAAAAPPSHHIPIPHGQGGTVYLAGFAPDVQAARESGGKVVVTDTACAVPGTHLVSLAIDPRGDVFAGTSDGRVLFCPKFAATPGASPEIHVFRAGDATSPGADTDVAVNGRGDLDVLLPGNAHLVGAPPAEVAQYAVAPDGSVSALRGVIRGKKTEISDPKGIAVDGDGRILVLNAVGSMSRILIFAPGATGDVAPMAIIGNSTGIVGDKTRLVTSDALAVDAQNRIYVANWDSAANGRIDWETPTITVFASDAIGNAAPIAAWQTAMFPSEIAVDGKGDIWVSVPRLPNGAPGVLVYARDHHFNTSEVASYPTGNRSDQAVAFYPADSIGFLAK
jgi:hypothetical protein